MHNVVSFSGGRTSAYLAYKIEEMRKIGEIENVHYVFMDTGAEHPKTYEFVRDVVKNFEIDLTCLRCKVDPEYGVGTTYQEVSIDDICCDLKPFHAYTKKYGTPNPATPKCTDVMKIQPHNKWCNDKFGKSNYITWLGIRIDEPGRLRPQDHIRYLADISDYEKVDVLRFWQRQDFDLKLDERESLFLGNCVFCIKKGLNKIAAAQRVEPELAERWNEMLCRDGIHRTLAKIESGIPNDQCYRSSKRFSDILEDYENVSTEYLIQRMKGTKNFGSCEESCEVFNCQLDMFKE